MDELFFSVVTARCCRMSSVFYGMGKRSTASLRVSGDLGLVRGRVQNVHNTNHQSPITNQSGDDVRGYLDQSPFTACLADPIVTPQCIFVTSRTSLTGSARPSSLTTSTRPRSSTNFSPTNQPTNRSKCTGTTAHTGQATPAPRCEPTFRSSETPALLVPKQRPCECRADFGHGPGPRSKCPYRQSPITNHQSSGSRGMRIL
jgi:hypothetical protein